MTDLEDSGWSFSYYLKRYPKNIGDLPLRVEAGSSWLHEDGRELIKVSGSFYEDREPREYIYESIQASKDDGWMLD